MQVVQEIHLRQEVMGINKKASTETIRNFRNLKNKLANTA